ncbi:MAG: DUF58 domain-containing protein, partial [Nocardiopsaceae bacterium]|nr:DUF58 domain-containing protein [Nocardiopsaceae bacterium]
SGAPRPGAGLLLAEDTLPAQFGPPPRFVLDRPRGGALRYQVRASARGKYPVGPLRVRVADPFGLVAITRPVGPAVTLTVTPRIVPLPGPPPGGTWPGDAHGRRGAAGDGEDDIAPRPYQVGDGLSRVHWRSTARYGELMVRREERRWRDTSALFLDTRRAAFGSDALFELAVTAAASIAVVLARRETGARLVTDSGDVASFGDTLLDTLAVIRPSRSAGLGAGAAELRSRGGPVIAVLGALTARQARQVAEAKAGASSAFALLVGKTTGPTGEATGLAGGTAGLGGETAGLGGKPAGSPAAGILAAAGWRVASVADEVSLAAAWRELRSREFADG